jgi:osmoprotectant transport system ATP-binding protein
MIELDRLVKRYATQTAPALDGLSLDLASGELTAVVGPSGSGKSTLLRCVNRMVEPDSGEVRIDGRSAREMDPVALRRATGYVIQGIGLFPHLSVAENIGVVPSLLGWSRDRIASRVEALLDLVRLPRSWGSRRPHELSGGEAQRVGVARALAADPPLLLMDEPFGALDALTRMELQDEFDLIRRELGKTVILVTHDLMEAFRLADRVVILRAGRVARQGSPAELAADPGDPLLEEFLSGIRSLERFIHEAGER